MRYDIQSYQPREGGLVYRLIDERGYLVERGWGASWRSWDGLITWCREEGIETKEFAPEKAIPLKR